MFQNAFNSLMDNWNFQQRSREGYDRMAGVRNDHGVMWMSGDLFGFSDLIGIGLARLAPDSGEAFWAFSALAIIATQARAADDVVKAQAAIAKAEVTVAKAESNLAKTTVHGHSLKSLRPTWGYKLYSKDGTFLKNGITSKVDPLTRYTRKYMLDKRMEPIKLFENRLEAYRWEFQENLIMRGPLNKNMH